MLYFIVASTNVYSQDFWKVLPVPDTCYITGVVANSYGEIFISTNEPQFKDGIYKTIDDGLTWQKVLDMGEFGPSSLTINNNGVIFASANIPGTYILKSEDDGISWTSINTPEYGSNYKIKTYGNDTLFVSQWASNGAVLIRSLDGGYTWQKIFESNNNASEVISGIEMTQDGKIYISLMCYQSNMGGIYLSPDFGVSWDFIGLLNNQVWDIALDSINNLLIGVYGSFPEVSGGIYFYDQSTGLISELSYGPSICGVKINSKDEYFVGSNMPPDFLKSDSSLNFTSITSGLPLAMPIGNLFLDSNEYLYATTPDPSNFLARSTQSTITSVNSNICSKHLFTVFPNPVTQCAVISFPSFRKNSSVNYRIIDLYGSEIQSDNVHLNNSSFTLDLSGFKKGLYILAVNQDGIQLAEKIIKF